MRTSVEFILGLLDRRLPAFVSAEDLEGVHGPALRLWQRIGLLSKEAEPHPSPSCPHCREGELYSLGSRSICGRCKSLVAADHRLLWRFDLEAFLTWLARKLSLEEAVRQVDDSLWQLGTLASGHAPTECFFLRGRLLSTHGRGRVLAFRNALVLRALPHSSPVDGFRGPVLALTEILRQDRRSLFVLDLSLILRGRGGVRLDHDAGALWAGDRWLGEVPVGSKEHHFLACLAERCDRVVPYADIKHYVLSHAGSIDSTEEATFCQKLKSRIKAKGWVPTIDRLIATTNKGEGYRLRGFTEP